MLRAFARCVASLGVVGLSAVVPATSSLAYNDPSVSCIMPTHGGPNPAAALRAPGAAQQTCVNSYIRLDISNPVLNQDFDLLYSGYYSGHPYISSDQPLYFLRSMGDPDSAGNNEFHKDWTDVRLNFNYFHAADTAAYYGSTAFGGPNMVLFPSSQQDIGDRDHIDIYLNHASDNIQYDFYPAHNGVLSGNPDQKEDLPFSGTGACNEYSFNNVSSAAVYRGVRKAPDYYAIVPESSATWFASGEHENTRIAHETQHLFHYSLYVVN